MDRELKLQIGGIGISIKWDGSEIINWPHPHYRDFIYEGKTEVNLRVHCGNLPRSRPTIPSPIRRIRSALWSLILVREISM